MRFAPHRTVSLPQTLATTYRVERAKTARKSATNSQAISGKSESRPIPSDKRLLIRIDGASKFVEPRQADDASSEVRKFGLTGLYRLVGISLVAGISAFFWTFVILAVARIFGTSLSTTTLAIVASGIFLFALLASAPFVASKSNS